ncbi:MAG TPA: flagellar hook capping FlgD N-terminal domain-containing protein [Stenotrophobium sp.]|nr:flagellar hook capping FlgD N-terminal domain-containing protein [Stenotrophobium sp.]
MTAIGSTSNTVDPSVLGSIGLATASSGQSSQPQQLSQDDFLKLMTAQLQNQDPLKPLDNSEFVSQMAQFSTVSGIQSLQNSFSSLSSSLSSSQSLQAASLVGHQVLVPSDTLALPATGTVQAAANLPASGDLKINITDAAGQVVRQMDLGAQSSGLAQVSWDGLDSTGRRLPAGAYTISAQVVDAASSSTQAAATYVAGNVNSVSLSASNGVTLNVQGAGAVAFSQVLQIM